MAGHVPSWARGVVAGRTWVGMFSNGAEFEIWTPAKNLSRKEARRLLLQQANGDYGEVYAKGDLVSVRKREAK